MRARGGSEQRSLFYYVRRNDNKGLVEAIENGGDLEERGGNYLHATPLRAASWRGHVEAVEILVKSGANVEVKDRLGNTPLICAAIHGHHEVVKLLLNAGADPDVKDNRGKSALHYAIIRNRYEVGVALMEGGANLELVLSFDEKDYFQSEREDANRCAPRLLAYYTETSATRKLLSHNELYRLFVSCKPMVLCNDVLSHVEKFLRWNCVAARSGRTCVRTTSDISGVNECVYSSSDEDDDDEEKEAEVPNLRRSTMLKEKRSRK